VNELRSAELVGKTVDALTATIATATTQSAKEISIFDKLSTCAQAVLSDVAWALRCGKSVAWCNVVAELGPRAISNLCDGFDRLHVAGFTRGALEARIRSADQCGAQSPIATTFVLTEAMCASGRLDVVMESARQRAFSAVRVPIALGNGVDQLDRDVARVAAVRALVGAACTIEVDAHGNLPPARAFEAVQRLAASARIVRVLRPFAAADVVEHRALQEALNAASIAVAICPGSCAAPLVAKQFVAEPTLRELAVEWRGDTTLNSLLSTLSLCALSNKTVLLLAESQLESLVMLQLAALSSRVFGTNTVSFALCDEDATHHFNNVPLVRNGVVERPIAPGISGGLTTQAFIDFDVTRQLILEHEQNNNSSKRARVDDVPSAAAVTPGVAAQAFDNSSAYAMNYAAMNGQMAQSAAMYSQSAPTMSYGNGVAASSVGATTAPTSSRATSMQCFVCKQTGHLVKDCPIAQANGRTDMCFQCGQPGHWASACPRRLPKGVCYNCGDAGHMAPACPQRPASTANLPQGHIRCYSCQQYGHTANNCPAKRQQQPY
jgi:hypothetical protein